MNLASNQMVIATSVLLLVYMVIIIFVVVKGALQIKNLSDYAVGSVHFSPVSVGLSLAAAITSAATFIINPGLIALYGISGVLSYAIVLPLAMFISLIIFTKGYRKFGSSVKALTMLNGLEQGTKVNHIPCFLHSFHYCLLPLLS
jgi:sodium/pantothenate symporter